MVVYERVSDVCPVPSVPADLAAKITVENAELQQLRRLYLVQRQLVELTVYFQLQHRGETGYVYDENSADAADASTLSSKRCQIFLLGSATLKEALDQAIAEFRRTSLGEMFECADSELASCIRLRRYNASNNRLGETFGGRENLSLQECGLSPAATLLLERRATTDAPFVEFNPREMQVRLSLWNTETKSSDSGSVVVVVPGEEAATVGNLRAQAANAFSIGTSDPVRLDKCCILILNTNTSVIELNDDSKQLKKDCGIYPGDEVIIDILPESSENAESKALLELRNRKRSAQIFFNNPADTDVAATSCPAYVQTVDVLLDCSLTEIKNKIAAVLNIQADSFHTKRNSAAPQLKDESKTLAELGFVDQSILHLTVRPSFFTVDSYSKSCNL
jgi:hypothetical protein